MKEDKDFLCTNMNKDDPLIEKYMKGYIKEKCESGQYPSSDDLIVNFDITYADGENESFTCGSESEPFGKGECKNTECTDLEKDKCISNKEDKCKNNQDNCNKADKVKKEKHYEKEAYEKKEKTNSYYANELDYYNEQFHWNDEEKWDNCQQEYNEYSKDISCKKEKKCKCINGSITVISTYSYQTGTRLKGVKINLYKLNGVCPELVDCQITDCDGKVIFLNLPKGSYRVIEIIDKRYFEKPCYVRWNEVTIDEENTSDVVYVINNIRQCITHS